jgi:DNA-binding MarR family transcriptional regulator
MHQIAHHGRQLFTEGLEREKLSLTHWMILEQLTETSTTMRALSELLAMPPSSITGLVDTLVERGIVSRSNDPSDRRIVRVSISEAGTAFVSRIRQHLMNQYRLAMQDMSDAELELMHNSYQNLLKQMISYRRAEKPKGEHT